nr:reverse transcriptase domain-containing protein [Tanacetum cinerariifolium]
MADNRTMKELVQAPTKGYSLNAAAGGNLLSKTTREALQIIENKSKVRYSRNKPNVSRMNTNSRDNASKSDDRIDKIADQISTLVDIFAKKIVAPAPVKAVEESCVPCGGAHAYYNCLNTDSNQPSVCVAMGTYNQVGPQNSASNFMAPPGFAPIQNSQNSNTILNPKGEMKAIATRSGVAYEGPSIPTHKKVAKQETEETTDNEQSNFQGSTTHNQPLVTPILKPNVSKTSPKPNIPYPSRLNDQKLREKATNQIEKFFQIFQDLHFDISFADALLLMPKFASTNKILLTNKDKLFELAKIPLNENCSGMLLKKLLEKLGDPNKFLIPCDFPRMDIDPLFVKVGKFHFLTDFVVVYFEAGPRVPLILGRSFLTTGRALIYVYGEEITLRVNDEAVTFNLNQTTRYSSTYDDLSVNRIDIIDIAREEYAQEILGFSSNSLGGNPTSTFEPILFYSSPSLTPFEGSDFILEEINNAYLKDESIILEIDHADCDPEGDICLIEKFPWVSLIHSVPKKGGITVVENQNNELIPTRCMMAIFHDMIEKTMEVFMDDFLVFGDLFSSCLSHLDIMLQRCEDTNLVLNWEKCPFMVKKGIILGHKISKNRLEVDRSKVDVIAKLPYPTTVKCVRSFLGHSGFYQRFIQDFSKIARPMTHLIEKDTPFVFSKDCIDAFKTLKKKLTEAPILVVPDWNLLFKLMCDVSDFAVGAVLGQRKTKHFQPIHYASKTMTEAQIQYTTIEKEMLAVVDFIGPFLSSRGNRYILIVVDYLSKWVEAKALPTNDARVIVKFLKSLFARFRTPKAIISDHGTHFCNDKFSKVMYKYGVTHRLSTAYHPQTSGQVEVSNRGLKRILEKTVRENRASWSEKLDDALLAFRTAYETPIGYTPYKLVYGKSCHLPIELQHKAYWTLKHVNFDLKTMGDY